MKPPFRSARARVQVETRSQFFADRWRVNRSRTLVRDNCDLLPFPAFARRVSNIGVGETTATAQRKHGGNALQKNVALLDRDRASRGHDDF